MKLYDVTIGGVVHTMQFADGDAPKGAVEVKAAAAPENKARKPRNKAKAQKAEETDGAAPAADA